MNKNKVNASKMGLIIGIIGFIAGIFFLFSKQYFIGISGSIASAGIAYKSYSDLKKSRTNK
ncbi:Kef-type K+ transport system membrane component KefB [Saonia flava]|uniref:Kef-type K+ transport system membrane component KefB n=1 Tax=Saonia flava TaxID=523696 RepID=A0A846QUF2_9FLAO|nr:hypothetical protein [Saonia flava]NJB71861.1 Kef-type K+ transport system membrane component KefB [Saonia flava]